MANQIAKLVPGSDIQTFGFFRQTAASSPGFIVAPTTDSTAGLAPPLYPALAAAAGSQQTYVYQPYSPGGNGIGILQCGAFVVGGFNAGTGNTLGRQIRGLQAYLQYGTEKGSHAGLVPIPCYINIQDGSTVSKWTTPSTDLISSTLENDVAGGVVPGSATGGYQTQLWSSLVTNDTAHAAYTLDYNAVTQASILVQFIQQYGTGGATPEMRIQSMQLWVYYNDPPIVTPSIPGMLAGNIATTLTPTINWTYTDPEGDAQQYCRVVVFRTADYTGAGSPAFTASNLPLSIAAVYDSGEVATSSTKLTIPAGLLSNYTQYTVFVLCSDSGSNHRYNTVTGSGTTSTANQGLNFTPQVDPILMPGIELPSTPSNYALSFDPITGQFTPIAVRARFNQLTKVDANFTSAAGTASVGGWTVQSGTGVLSAGAINGRNCAIVTSAGAVTTVVQSPAFAVTPGAIFTASVKGWNPDPNTQVLVTFYSDSAGTVSLASGTADCASDGTAFIANPTTNTIPTKTWVQGRVPVGAVAARVQVYLPATAASRASYVTQAEFTPNSIGLLDDPSFENSTVSTNSTFWTATPGAGAIVYKFNDTVNGQGASWPLGLSTIELDAPFSKMQTSYYMALNNSSVVTLLTGVDAINISQPGFNAVATVSVGVVTSSQNPARTWTRIKFPGLTNSGIGVNLTTIGINVGAAGTKEIVDNLQCEMLWPLSSGSGVNGSALPRGSAFGWVASQGWMRWDAGTGVTTYDTTVFQTGGISIKMSSNVGTANAPAVVEQFFTVSGYSSFTLSGYVWQQQSTLTGVVQFYDNAGVLLSSGSTFNTNTSTQFFNTLVTANVAPTNGALTAFNSGAITVPATAAFARVYWTSTAYLSPGLSWINGITLTPTGTLSVSSNWIDGGWSGGGLATPVVTLQHSPTAFSGSPPTYAPSGAGFVRAGNAAGSAGSAVTLAGNYEYDFSDYEFPGGLAGLSQTVYYVAGASFGSSLVSPLSAQVAVTNANAFTSSGWMLIDPLVPADNIVLQVKKVTFQTDENQTVLMPAGRGRKVVMGDTQIFGDTITVELLTISNADFAALQKQYSKVYPLMLRSPDGEVWYVRFTKRTRERVWMGTYTRPFRTYSFTMEQVNAVA